MTAGRQTKGWPDSSDEQSSMSSSISSSVASSMLHAGGPSASSHSDFEHDPNAAPTLMGQSNTKAAPAAGPQQTVATRTLALGSAAAATTGLKLKRALNVKRKKTTDDGSASGKSAPPSPSHTSADRSRGPPPSPSAKSGKALGLGIATHVFTGAKRPLKSPDTAVSPTIPPPTPPKPDHLVPKKSATVPEPLSVPPSDASTRFPNRQSIIPLSPGISSAVRYLRNSDSELRHEQGPVQTHHEPIPKKEEEKLKHKEEDSDKEAWRKSDSTMSHHTIRPGATVGSRTPRPGSIAESTNTITGAQQTRRLSALLTDVDCIMPEEDDGAATATAEDHPTPQTSQRAVNRRSMSLNLGAYQYPKAVPPSASDVFAPEVKPAPLTTSSTQETRAAANGIIAPSSSGVHTTGSNIRGRLAAWTSASHRSNSPQQVGQGIFAHRNGPSQSNAGSGNPAVSVSNSFGPAAGLAKRAVEKMGRAWGGINSSSAGSGYSSSSSSSTGPSSFHGIQDLSLTRTQSGQSSQKGKNKKDRRTPNAPSGAWSISSSVTGNSSDSDAFSGPSGPVLGTMLRGPLTRNGGVVFGKKLKGVVQRTAIGVGMPLEESADPLRRADKSANDFCLTLERRQVPALVARCAQHIFIWGIQEEGLFRINGRPAHVSKIRTEFDTGADYDMMDCSPGELDPHAVAGVFKAYLREMPEPILTHALMPYFDAAMGQEDNSKEEVSTPAAKVGGRGPSLPSGPKSGPPQLRKPPSLSTLAMPNFNGMRPPSKNLLKALKSLIDQLPRENRDLLRTVIDLIKVTASESKVTKMPLSNLMLVFCPSLHMNPPLLRVLSEYEEIWTQHPYVSESTTSVSSVTSSKQPQAPVADDDKKLDIKRDDNVVLDIKAPEAPSKDSPEEPTSEGPSQSSGEEVDLPMKSAPVERSSSPAQIPELSSRPLASPKPASLIDVNGAKSATRARPVGPRHAHTPNASISGIPTSVFPSTSSDADLEVSDTPNLSRNPSENSNGHAALSDASQDSSSSVLSPSEESLATPSRSSLEVSTSDEPLASAFTKHSAPSAPVIGDMKRRGSDSARRPTISGPIGPPIHFPGTLDVSSMSVPNTPLSPRRSVPVLSLPNFVGQGTGPDSPKTNSPLRMKRPSLHLLFSRKSGTSLSSPQGNRPSVSAPLLHPRSVSDSSAKPIVDNDQSGRVSPYVLPNLDSIEHGSGLGLDFSAPTSPTAVDSEPTNPEPKSISTPIADLYKSSTSSLASLPSTSAELPAENHLRGNPGRQHKSTASQGANLLNNASSHGVVDDREIDDDWTKTVLMAADVDWRSIPTTC